MRKTYLVLLLVLVPLMIAGFTNSPFENSNSVKQDIAYRHQQYNQPFQPVSRDRNWRLIEELRPSYNDNNVLVDHIKLNYYYNLNFPNRVDSIIYSLYDPDWVEPEMWVAMDNFKYSYDTSGEFVTSIEDIIIANNSVYQRVTGVYDAQNRLTDVNEYTYDQGLHQTSMTHISYNNDLISSFDSYGFSENQENGPYLRTMLNQDAQGRISIETNQEPVDSTNWENISRYLYTYHTNDATNGLSYIDYISHNYLQIRFSYL
jgi:hypothetical protein